MSKSVTLSDETMVMVRREAALQRRTLAGQLRHWVRVGRAIEETGALSYRQIRALLVAFDQPDPPADT